MKTQTLDELKRAMLEDEDHWYVPFMDFVDDFRRSRDSNLIQPWRLDADRSRYDALLASTIEYLCDEQGIEPPAWVWDVPACTEPWFVSGIENLKAMAIAQSPVHFRRRKIFVLDNFLSRV